MQKSEHHKVSSTELRTLQKNVENDHIPQQTQEVVAQKTEKNLGSNIEDYSSRPRKPHRFKKFSSEL